MFTSRSVPREVLGWTSFQAQATLNCLWVAPEHFLVQGLALIGQATQMRLSSQLLTRLRIAALRDSPDISSHITCTARHVRQPQSSKTDLLIAVIDTHL